MSTDSRTAYGYDGNGYTIGNRVELHPGLDWWMRGVRYGVVVRMSLTPRDRVTVEMDNGRWIRGSADRFRVVGGLNA